MLIEINFSGYEKERDVPQTELTETFYLTMIIQVEQLRGQRLWADFNSATSVNRSF